jgi:hypothetical protein
MKIRIKVHSLSSDGDHGTNTSLFSNEEKAVDALLDEHLVEVEGSNIPFIEQIADMTQD